MMVQSLGALPIAGEIAVPVDAAGEAGLREGVDEHFFFFSREDRRARIVPGIVVRDHLRESQIDPRRRAHAGDRLFRRRALGTMRWLAHEGVKGLLDAAAKDLVGLARGVLELDDVHLVAKTL